MPDVLEDKQYKNYLKLSRYSTFPFYYHTIDKKYINGTPSHLDDTTAYTTHIVMHGDTLDNLSLYYYNDPTKWWMIADFNRIQDPYKKLDVGSRIKVPTISSIRFGEGR